MSKTNGCLPNNVEALKKVLTDAKDGDIVKLDDEWRLAFEQKLRDLLTNAIAEGIVGETSDYRNPDPQSRSSGELTGTANLLAAMLRGGDKPHDTRPSMTPSVDEQISESDRETKGQQPFGEAHEFADDA